MIDDATIKMLAEQCGIELSKLDANDALQAKAIINIKAFATACYAAGQDAQCARMLYIGAVTEDGVVWANQNPSSYPVGAMFYAVIPKEP